MADIKKELNDIKNAVYGREVRGSIHDGIKKINDEVENATYLSESAKHQVENIQQQVNQLVVEGDSSVEAAQARVDAEGKSYPTLKARLDAKETEFSSQLAQTAQEVDMTKSELKNKRDKNIKITKSDYDLSQDFNKWNINDFDEDTRKAILESQGIDVNYVLGKNSVTRENISNHSVYPEKTTFAKSKNLWNGIFYNGYLSGGNVDHPEYKEGVGYKSCIVEVEKNKTYTISKGKSNRFRVATNEGYPVVGERMSRNIIYADSQTEVTLTMKNNEDHIIIYVSKDEEATPWVQVEEGESKTEYSPPGKEVVIDYAKRKTPYNFIKNLMLQGVIAGSGRSFNINTKKEQIETLRAGGHVYVGDERYFLKDGEFSYSSFSDNTVLVFYNIKSQDIIFVRLSEKVNDENLVFIGVIRRDEHIYSFNGIYSIDGRFINVKPDIPLVKHRSIPQDYKYQLTDYIHVKRDDGGWGIDDLYGEYDDLVNKYNFVSRSLFATENVSNLPIYRYDFVLSGIENHTTKKIIVTAPHGHEHQSQVATAKFFKDLCERWQEEKILETLKYGYHIIVIPALSPYAVDNGRRTNANGVDLNRNFPEGWTLTDEGSYYSGPEPLSENASLALRDLFINTQNIAFHVDIHNSGADTVLDGWPEPVWIGTNMNEIRPVISEALIGMRAIVDKRYNPTDFNFEIWRNHRAIEGGIVRYANSLGIRSYILEMKWAINGDYELGQQFNVDMIGNAFTTFVNYSEI